MKRTRGFTLVELLVVVAIIAMLVAILLPVLSMVEELANRSVCASNLKNIGAGIRMYQTNNKNSPPWLNSINSPGSSYNYAFGTKTGTNAESQSQPSSLSPTAMMFLLVRAGQNAELFRCPSDDHATKMDRVKFTDSGDSYYYWDFYDEEGSSARDHCKKVSYSYQSPAYDGVVDVGGVNHYAFKAGYTRSSKGGLAIMADKTPAYDYSGYWTATDWTIALSDDERKAGMSQNHDYGDFINVLFADYHVKGSKRADVGLRFGNNNFPDNIYTGYFSGVYGPSGRTHVSALRHEDDSYLIGPIK